MIEDPIYCLAVGGSAGSLQIILEMLPKLDKDLAFPVLVVIHRKPVAESALINLFQARSSLPTSELDEKEVLLNGHVYLAPANYHTLIEPDRTFSLDVSEKIHYSRPSIDVTFESMCDIYRKHAAAILLSGANADGVSGLLCIKNSGGITAIQNPSTAEIAYMPNQALINNAVDFVLENSDLAHFINKLSQKSIELAKRLK